MILKNMGEQMDKMKISEEILSKAKAVLQEMIVNDLDKKSLGDSSFPNFYIVRGEPKEGVKIASLESPDQKEAYIISL